MIVTSHPQADPFRVTACRNILIMHGEREPALCHRLGGSSATGPTQQSAAGRRYEGRSELRLLDMVKTGLDSMEPIVDDRSADGDLRSDQNCARCAASGVTTTLHEDSFQYGSGETAVTLHATIPVRKCTVCDFTYIDYEGQRSRDEAVRHHHGFLTAREIRAVRKRYAMSRMAFARITGLEEATLSRWEKGTLMPNRADDNYLRLLELPENLERLRGKESREGRCNRN